MKDSGIEWIGEIPSSWRINKIKHNFIIVSGATPKSENTDYWDGDITWITPADYKTQDKYVSHGKRNITQKGYDSCGTTIVPTGSIVFSKRAPVGTVAITEGELCTNQGCLSCVQKELANSTYYYYVMSIFTEQFELLSSGTTFKEISANAFADFCVPNPTIKEQKRIADFLDKECARIDTVIEKTKASLEKYKKLKQSVITQAVTKGIRPNRKMKDSGIEWIGEIPESYSVERIKHLGDYRNGLTYAPEQVVDEGQGILVLRSSNVQQGKLCFEDNVYVNMDIPEHLMVQKGDIIICSRNGSRELIGKCAIVEDDMVASFGAFMMIFRGDSPKYMYYILNSSVFKYYLSTFLTSTINQLTGGNFGNMAIVWCDNTDEQEEIVEYLDNETTKLDTLILQKETLLSELESYKKSLIFEYVTGKKEVV